MSEHYGECEKCGRLSGINDNLVCFECRCCPKKTKKIDELQSRLETTDAEIERLKERVEIDAKA